MKNKAFTLIELLVVVLIIGILSAIALPQYQKAVSRAKFTQVLVYMDAFVKAQKLYFMANGFYATNYDELDIQVPTTESAMWCKHDPNNGGNAFALCWVKDSAGNPIASLSQYYHDASRICCAYKATNWRGDDLCKLEMHNTTSYDGCGSGLCKCYREQ